MYLPNTLHARKQKILRRTHACLCSPGFLTFALQTHVPSYARADGAPSSIRLGVGDAADHRAVASRCERLSWSCSAGKISSRSAAASAWRRCLYTSCAAPSCEPAGPSDAMYSDRGIKWHWRGHLRRGMCFDLHIHTYRRSISALPPAPCLLSMIHAHTRTNANAHTRVRARAHTHTNTYTHTHTHTHTHMHSQTHTDPHAETYITDAQTHRHIETRTRAPRHTDTNTHNNNKHTQTHRQTDRHRQIHRHMDTQIQTYRIKQTDTYTHTHTHKY